MTKHGFLLALPISATSIGAELDHSGPIFYRSERRPSALVVADLTGDGLVEFAVTNSDSASVSVYGNRDGRFFELDKSYAPTSTPSDSRRATSTLTVSTTSSPLTAETGTPCADCHAGSLGTVGEGVLAGDQTFKVAQLRGLYQKVGMFGSPLPKLVGDDEVEDAPTPLLGEQIRGFGFTHNGSIPTLIDFLRQPIETFVFPDTPGHSAAQRVEELAAFLLVFPTGLAPAIGSAGDPSRRKRRGIVGASRASSRRRARRRRRSRRARARSRRVCRRSETEASRAERPIPDVRCPLTAHSKHFFNGLLTDSELDDRDAAMLMEREISEWSSVCIHRRSCLVREREGKLVTESSPTESPRMASRNQGSGRLGVVRRSRGVL